MILVYTAKLGLQVYFINLEAWKIDKSIVIIYSIVMANF